MCARVGKTQGPSDRRSEVSLRVRQPSIPRVEQPLESRQSLSKPQATLQSASVTKTSTLYDLNSPIMIVGAGKRLRSAAFVLLTVMALGYLYLFNPATTSLYPTCPFYWATGCYCPGCGTLRALHQLLHGHLWTALGLNPLTVVLLPLLGYWFLSEAKQVIVGFPLPRIHPRARTTWVLLGLILAYWILRNLPFYPFTVLAP